jgi:hypothetical protein
MCLKSKVFLPVLHGAELVNNSSGNPDEVSRTVRDILTLICSFGDRWAVNATQFEHISFMDRVQAEFEWPAQLKKIY